MMRLRRVCSGTTGAAMASLLLALTACAAGSGGAGTDGGTGTDASTDSTNTGSTGGGSTDGTGSGGTDSTGTDPQTTAGPGSTGGGTDGPPPPEVCADKQLPSRDGAEIVVAPGANGMVTVDGSDSTLRQVVSGAQSGDTILFEDGTYTFPEAGPGEYTGIYVTTPDITLRSAGGDPTAVILDSAYGSHGDSSAPITIAARGVVVADLTVQRSVFHLIHLWAGGDDAIVHNVHMVDGGQQFLKASPGDGTVDDVEVSCSRFVMTTAGRDNVWGYGPPDGSTTCYTGGIDTHDARNWHVHHSSFQGIYCDATGVQRPAHGKSPELRNNMTYTGGLAEHGIHMWDSEQGSGHLIERNRIVNCARGIGIGLTDQVYGTTVVNNMVYSEHAGSGEHDVGIIVERAVDTVVAFNSVYLSHVDSYPRAIEYRWDTTSNLAVHGNLTNREIRARDNAVATEADNVTDADPAWFLDAAAGELHLADCTAPGPAASLAGVPTDFDGDPRFDPTAPGADECAP